VSKLQVHACDGATDHFADAYCMTAEHEPAQPGSVSEIYKLLIFLWSR